MARMEPQISNLLWVYLFRLSLRYVERNKGHIYQLLLIHVRSTGPLDDNAFSVRFLDIQKSLIRHNNTHPTITTLGTSTFPVHVVSQASKHTRQSKQVAFIISDLHLYDNHKKANNTKEKYITFSK